MTMLKKRAAGLLIPVYSLRGSSDLGIGDTSSMISAIDFCVAHNFRILQTLPIHDTLGDNSPYNPISAHALSYLLLSLKVGEIPGLTPAILAEHAEPDWVRSLNEGNVKYDLVRALKRKILVAAYENWLVVKDEASKRSLQEFRQNNTHWLPAYSLYRTLASLYDHSPNWLNWREDHRSVEAAEVWLEGSEDYEKLSHYRSWIEYVQWVTHEQWINVKNYADSKEILLMGEMSFGVSKSSADVWANPEFFDLEWSMGTRPVSYFDTSKDSERWGQNWGLPPYLWDKHREDNFQWLRQRIYTEAKYFHIVRLDHLRGYFRAYMFPWQGGAEHAEYSLLTDEEAFTKAGERAPRFVPGSDEDPIASVQNEALGRELIGTMKDAAKECILFGELMGQLPDYMRRVLDDLQIANLSFPLLSTDVEGRMRPTENLRELSLISYGNHDHASLYEYYQQLLQKVHDQDGMAQQALHNLLIYAKWEGDPPEHLSSELLEHLQKSLLETPQILANLSVADLLGIPLRFNLPGTYGEGTWAHRLPMSLEDYLKEPEYAKKIKTASRLIVDSQREAWPL